MSTHFSANQYQKAFESRPLQNWEVPFTYRLRPRALRGSTVVIANEGGHLLPGVKRSRASPWGTFIGTWDMPLKIPGNQMTNWTARSPGAQNRLEKMKTDGDIILQGKLKKCKRLQGAKRKGALPNFAEAIAQNIRQMKIPSPLPIKGDDPMFSAYTPEKPISSRMRSGAKNPEPNGLYKSVTPVKSTSPLPVRQFSPVPVPIRQITPLNTPKLDWPRPGSRARSSLPNISQNAFSPKPTDGYQQTYDPEHQALMQERSSKSPIVWPAPKQTQLEV